MAAISASALAIISVATTVVGAGVAIYGQEQQKKSARRVAEFNAKVKENEAIRLDMEARENIRRKRKQNRRILSAQRAKIGASGVTFAGSPLEALGENAATLELGVFDLSRAADAKRRSLISQAGQTREEGEAIADAISINQASTLLNTASGVTGSVFNFKQQGVF